MCISALGLGRILLLYELIKEVRGLAEPTSVLHVKKEIRCRKELLLSLTRVPQRFQKTLVSQMSNAVFRRSKQFGDVYFGQSLVEGLSIHATVIKRN
jgi:hypothetical protein